MLTLKVLKTKVFFFFMKMNKVVTDLSVCCCVFQHPFVPKVNTETLGSVSDFCPFLPGGLTSFFDILVCLLLGFKIFYLLQMLEMLWLLNESEQFSDRKKLSLCTHNRKGRAVA
jgi:hypothetical protein